MRPCVMHQPAPSIPHWRGLSFSAPGPPLQLLTSLLTTPTMAAYPSSARPIATSLLVALSINTGLPFSCNCRAPFVFTWRAFLTQLAMPLSLLFMARHLNWLFSPCMVPTPPAWCQLQQPVFFN
ncbi:hypothetical protein GOP47_0027970 [Adiantum capillus-veneris]|nr:hypothetical protein GOP47_0027970 [Adiantum capillus-veneris]